MLNAIVTRVTTILLFLHLFHAVDAQNISKVHALEDLEEFETLLERESSYYQLSEFDFKDAINKVETRFNKQDSIPVYELAYAIEKIVSELIDRHASVKMKNFDEDKIEMFDLHFPFSLAPFQGQVVALKRNKETKQYEYYAKKYPFVKQINGIPTIDFIEQYAYKRKQSPTLAKLYDGTKDLRDIGELFFKQGQPAPEELNIVLSNGTKDKTYTLPLSKKKKRWANIGHVQDYALIKAIYFDEPFDFNKLDKWLTDSIAYLQLPGMLSYEGFPTLESHIQTTVEKYRDSKAFIIDVRGNSGGTRDLLNTLSGYMVQPKQSPWVANVAFVRSDQQLDEDIESMQSRYLYNSNSTQFTDDDRKAIDTFTETFKTKLSFDFNKFSAPFYMVLKSNGNALKCPIYILTDERSFSAASVFTSAFKGLPNVTIVGTNTNGSSGRSARFKLTHSQIRVKLSTMLSFQRDGKTLDGNGTAPDIVIEMQEDQVLGKKDTQLEEVIKLIEQQ